MIIHEIDNVMKRIVIGIAIALMSIGAPAIAEPNAVEPAAEDGRYGTANLQADNYHLGNADRIRITVFNEPTLSGEFIVGADGMLSLPLIGSVPAADKTSAEIVSEVQSALADGYLRDPKVAGEVTIFRPFFILGEIKMGGQYAYASGLTVYNAIATAQGFTPRANRKQVFIKSAGATEEKSYRLTPDLKVFPGDTIRIRERYF